MIYTLYLFLYVSILNIIINTGLGDILGAKLLDLIKRNRTTQITLRLPDFRVKSVRKGKGLDIKIEKIFGRIHEINLEKANLTSFSEVLTKILDRIETNIQHVNNLEQVARVLADVFVKLEPLETKGLEARRRIFNFLIVAGFSKERKDEFSRKFVKLNWVSGLASEQNEKLAAPELIMVALSRETSDIKIDQKIFSAGVKNLPEVARKWAKDVNSITNLGAVVAGAIRFYKSEISKDKIENRAAVAGIYNFLFAVAGSSEDDAIRQTARSFLKKNWLPKLVDPDIFRKHIGKIAQG